MSIYLFWTSSTFGILVRALAARNRFRADFNRKGKKQILVSKKCPCEIQIGANWYKLVRKENQQKAGLVSVLHTRPAS